MPFMELENLLQCSQGPAAGHNIEPADFITPARTVSVRSTLMLTYPPSYA